MARLDRSTRLLPSQQFLQIKMFIPAVLGGEVVDRHPEIAGFRIGQHAPHVGDVSLERADRFLGRVGEVRIIRADGAQDVVGPGAQLLWAFHAGVRIVAVAQDFQTVFLGDVAVILVDELLVSFEPAGSLNIEVVRFP